MAYGIIVFENLRFRPSTRRDQGGFLRRLPLSIILSLGSSVSVFKRAANLFLLFVIHENIFAFLFIYSALSGLEHCDCLWLPPQTHTKFLARHITSSWRYDLARIIFASFFISLL